MKTPLRFGLLVSVLAVGWTAIPSYRAAETAPSLPALAEVSYNRDIRPILSNKCFKCHGPDLKKAGLNLRERDIAIKKGALVPGKSQDSELIGRITDSDPDNRMPPGADPLSPDQVAKLKAWIDQGAKYEQHWAYVRPIHHPLPEVANKAWVRNGIDAFILARLEKEGLAPSAEADRATLIRRVSLDLTGLPPSVAEVDDFLNDRSPGAYEKVVDRLLQSPHYGEHQARPWLDMARYADTNGYEKDDRRTMWPYRDWVIHAFNRDLPFDQFTIEQLAGDLLPGATAEQKVATGFQRNTMVNTEGGTDPEEFRIAAIVDRVNTTAEVWLGSTLACAQCHNHKFDPFSQKEYYQLFAFYNNTADSGGANDPQMPVPTPEQAAQQAKLEAEIAKVKANLEASTPELLAAQAKWEKEQDGAKAGWTPLELVEAKSGGGATLTRQPDGSLLASGTNPDKDTYTLVYKTPQIGITGLRLEVLPDASLGGMGPGRTGHGNFVLNELRVAVAKAAEPTKPSPVVLQNPSADWEQKSGPKDHFPIAAAIDGDVKTGWAVAPQFGKPHTAVFETRDNLAAEGGTLLTFTLEQTFGSQHTIGRLRLSATTAPRPLKATTLPDAIVKVLATSAAERTPGQKDELAKYFRSIASELAKVREQLAALQKQQTSMNIPTTLVMQELPKPRPTHVMIRGNAKNPGDKVDAGVPSALNPLPSGQPANRLALARWLVDPANPLVGRVLMNRIWARYFGRGFVETSDDFGAQGEPPSHPELLDWLATELTERKGSLKAMHRLIVTSATYRQSASVPPQLKELDPFNRLVARGPRLRMDAEMVRDNALAISGLLSRKIGGPSVFPYQPDGVWFNPYSGDKWVTSKDGDQYRRGLYTFWRRTAPYAAFMAFDAPSREVCTERRPRTNTPLQALATLNDKAFVDCAAALARRMMAEAKGGERERAVYGFRLCVARAPSNAETDALVALHRENVEKYKKAAAAAKALATGGLAPPPKEMDVAELAAWTVVANVLLNLDEAITKG